MRVLSEAKQAIISTETGTLTITIGERLNEKNENFHDDVSIEVVGDGAYVKGKKIKTVVLYGNADDEIVDSEERFKKCCEDLIGFSDLIKTRQIKKFSWKKLMRVVIREEKYVFLSYLRNNIFIYKKEFWPVNEYKSNVYLIKDLG